MIARAVFPAESLPSPARTISRNTPEAMDSLGDTPKPGNGNRLPRDRSDGEKPPHRIYRKRSPHTGIAYLYGDFRRFADVGGRLEPLRLPGFATATTDPDEAVRLYVARVDHYKRLRNSELAGRPLLEAVRFGPGAVAFLKYKSALRGKSRGTVERDEVSFRVLLRHFGSVPLMEITSARLLQYVAARQLEPGSRTGSTVADRTIRNELHSLSSLFEWAVAKGYVLANPVRRMVGKPPVPDSEAAFLSAVDARRLLEAAAQIDLETRPAYIAARLRSRAKALGDARKDSGARSLRDRARDVQPNQPRYPNLNKSIPFLEPIIATLLYTGGRISEVLGLLVSDIDFENGVVRFRPNRYRALKRSRHRRAVTLWPFLEQRLRIHLRQFTPGADELLFPSRWGTKLTRFDRPLDRCCMRAGLDPCITPHTLRHTFATMLLQTLVRAEDGGFAVRSSFNVARQLGHKSSALVDSTYGHAVEAPVYRQTLSYE